MPADTMPYGAPRQNDRYSRPQAAPVQARHEIGSFHGRGRGGLLPAIMAMSLRIFRDTAAVRYWTLVTYPNGRDFLIKQEAEGKKPVFQRAIASMANMLHARMKNRVPANRLITQRYRNPLCTI